MLGRKAFRHPELFTFCDFEKIVPESHILRRIDKVVDFSWLLEEVEELYSEENGRPSVDPEVIMRLMLAGFLLGIRHDRALMREAQVNMAIRLFIGYGIGDELPDHSTLSRTRARWGKWIFHKFFLVTVKQCIDAGLVNANTVHVDSTLVRASVSWNKVRKVVKKHVEGVGRVNEKYVEPAKKDGKKDKGIKEKAEYICESDPDATLATSSSVKIPEPSYKQHNAVDDNGIIVDTMMTTGSVYEGHKLMEHIDNIEENTGQTVHEVTADKGYSSSGNYAACEEMGICALIPTQDEKRKQIEFRFDAFNEVIICPKGKKFSNYHEVKGAREYRLEYKRCSGCEFRDKCYGKKKTREVRISDNYESLLRARRKKAKGWNDAEREMYKRHWTFIEGVHGEMKERHCLRRAVRRGLWNMEIQGFLAALAVNLKRLSKGVLDKTSGIIVFRSNLRLLWLLHYCTTNSIRIAG